MASHLEPCLTEEEIAILKLLGNVYRSFMELPKQHPNEFDNAVNNIHLLQQEVIARSTRRQHPELFN